MTIDLIIFYTTASALSIVAIALLVTVRAYSRLAKESYTQRKKRDQWALPAEKEATKIITNAEKQAADILEKAHLNAVAIENSAHMASDEMQKMLDDKLKEIVANETALMQSSVSILLDSQIHNLETVSQDNIKTIKNISKDIEIDSINEMKNFRETLRSETILSQKEISKQIEKQFLEIQNELAAYKVEHMQLLSNDILKILQEITEQVVGRVISMSDHQKLILEALEQAKKEGVFEIK